MNLLETAIGWLAPPLCIGCELEGWALCPDCAKGRIIPLGVRCWRCGAVNNQPRLCNRCKNFGGPRNVWVTTQYDGLAKRLVQAYKFGQQRVVAEPLAQLMKTTLILQSEANKGVDNYLVVSLSTATTRIRQRGFDHSALLAKRVAGKLGFEHCNALGRLGQTRQLGSQRETRLSQPEENYYVRRPDRVKGQNILLIDDVLTTGATLRAAAKELRTAGARHVDALVFAKRL